MINNRGGKREGAGRKKLGPRRVFQILVNQPDFNEIKEKTGLSDYNTLVLIRSNCYESIQALKEKIGVIL